MTAEALRIPDALQLAMMRKIARLGALREAIERAGWSHIVTLSELYLLEAEGFTVDFDSGMITPPAEEVTR